MLLLFVAMAAIIGHRALSQLRAAGRPGLFPNAQRNGLPRSRQVSASGHGNAQQHTGFMSSQHRASSPATCALVHQSVYSQLCLPPPPPAGELWLFWTWFCTCFWT